jgi:quercetin dioxygenase-like cupin family protein
MTEHDKRAIHLAPGDGVSIKNPVGGPLTFKVRADQTNGALTVVESTAPPGEGPPLHVHANEDEALYTLEGTLRFRLGDEVQTAPAGAFAFIPRGTPHTWQNVGEAPARLLVIFTPAAAAVERFFERFSELSEDEAGLEAFRRLAREAATDVVGQPLAESHPL